tara:strand:- start:326 stop:628 length:303 start_codon:yes stop_codon:yes gene_type:complete
MIDTITKYQFSDEMVKHGFSYDGSKALFNYLEQLEEDCDTKIEFDPVALRCDYDEYDNLKECLKEYDNISCCELKSIEDLKDYTTVIEVDNSEKIIIQAF